MNKEIAIKLLGGTPGLAAKAIGITPQAISAWPDELPATISDRVEAAYHRLKGIQVPAGDAAAEASHG